MTWYTSLLFIVINYLFFPVSIYILLKKLFDFSSEYNFFLYAISLALAPPLLSVCIYYLLLLFPKQNDFFYIIFILLLFGIPFILNKKKSELITDLLVQTWTVLCSLNILEMLLLVIIIITNCSFLYLFYKIPLQANDPLLYFEISRYIYETKDVLVYPFQEPYFTGYYGPSWHPPSFHCLLVWSFMFQGGTLSVLLGKIFSAYFALVSCLLLIVSLCSKGRIVALTSALLLLLTPLYFSHVLISHIDAYRISCFLAASCWLVYFIDNPSKKNAIMLGVLVGFAMRAHAFGLLALPFICIGVLLLSPAKFKFRIESTLWVVFVSFLICGFDYGRIMFLSNSLIPGTEEEFGVYSLKHLKYQDFLETSRGIHSFQNIIWNGLLKGFSRIDLYGLSYWLTIGGVWVVISRKLRDSVTMVFGLQIVLYYILVILTIAFGKSILIKNSRYFLLIHPFVVYFSSLCICTCLEYFKSQGLKGKAQN